jgi:hypothetical protein
MKNIIRKFVPAKLRYLRRIICRKQLKQYLLFKHQFKKLKSMRPSDCKNYLSVVAIVKNEAPYIAEWIEYHLIVGVEKFYIYDNESTDNLKEILAPYINQGIVEYFFFPGIRKQISAYNESLKFLRTKTFWVAFIDLDEFIVPVGTDNIPDFLRNFEKRPGLELNWVLYGSSGHRQKTDRLVIERFKDHDDWDSHYNHTAKSIVNPRYVFYMTAHIAEYVDGMNSVNTNNEINLKACFDRPALHDKLRVNHYFLKSLEEFSMKISRGRATSPGSFSLEEFYRRDCNNIKNDPIMDKYIPLVKENILKRFS